MAPEAPGPDARPFHRPRVDRRDPGARLHARILLEWIDDELALHDPWSDSTLLLNAGAARVLELCDGRRDAGDIARTLARPGAGPSVWDLAVPAVLDELGTLGFLEGAGPAGACALRAPAGRDASSPR